MEKETITPRTPELKFGIMPVWCHHHCTKMQLKKVTSDSVFIAGSAASVTIQRRGVGEWYIDWTVIQSADCRVTGRVYMDSHRLKAAFGLHDYTDQFSGWLIQRYGGDAASQGAYIRFRDFLNIPHPGTGNDGDPNVSVELDDEIKKAVRKLLAS